MTPLLLLSLACGPREDPLATITAADLQATVATLAAPGYRGRLPGDRGYDEAAAWAAGRLAALGLAVEQQPLVVEHNRIGATRITLLLGEEERELTLGEDYVLRGFTGAGALTAPVVFAGYGSVDGGYDDFAGADLQGKAALVFKQGPDWGTSLLPRARALAVRERGGTALLMVSRPLDEPPQPLIGSVMHGPGQHPADLPQVHLSQASGAALLGTDDLGALQRALDASHTPAPFEAPHTVRIQVDATWTAAAATTNVVATLPGTDLAESVVVVGAHLDHVGMQGELLFPGANDNASGSAAVLEIAEALASSGSRPRRTVVFVLFASEEQGLHGARAFVEAGPVPMDQVHAMINLDCVGHGDGLRVGGKGAWPEGWALVRGHDLQRDGIMVEESWESGGADAQPFADAGVRTLYFAAEHAYTHLHLPSDTPDTLNQALHEEITRLAFLAVRDLADSDG